MKFFYADRSKHPNAGCPIFGAAVSRLRWVFAPRANRISLCACLLIATASLAQTQPAETANPAAPAEAPVTVTKPLISQPKANAKPISRRQALEADNAYIEGSALMEKKEPEKAEKAFQRAVKLNPEKQEYTVAAAIALENVVNDMVRKSQVMRAAGNAAGADALLADAAKLDPQNDLITEHQRQASAPQMQIEPYFASGDNSVQTAFAPVMEFAPEKTLQSFHFRADAHEAVRRILLAYGLKAQFNADVPAASVRIDIDDVDFRTMRPILSTMTQSFLVPIDTKTALVLKDTQENHDQFDHLALETIYMPGFTTEQIHDASTMLQQVLNIQKVEVSPHSGTISIRAPLEMMKIANYELADLMDGGNQLLLEMKVYEIDKTNTKNIGIPLTTSVSAFAIYPEVQQALSQYSSQIAQAIANGLIPANTSPIQIFGYLFGAGLLSSQDSALVTGLLGTIGNGITYTGVTAASLPSLNFGLNSSEAKSLDEVQLSVGDRKTATFRVGTKYPIITASYSSGITPGLLAGVTPAQLAALGIPGGAAGAAAAAAQASIPQIQYEDLGLTLKAEPTVLRSGNVSMKLDLKIEALGGSALNGIPILASRALTSSVTLMPGQSAMLVSSMSRQESNAVSGIPGLSELPGFQSTTNSDKELDTTELIITLTPKLVRSGRNRMASMPLAFPQAAAKEAHNDE